MYVFACLNNACVVNGLTPIIKHYRNAIHYKAVWFRPKVGQIGLKWDKSGTFSDQISVHFGSRAKMY